MKIANSACSNNSDTVLLGFLEACITDGFAAVLVFSFIGVFSLCNSVASISLGLPPSVDNGLPSVDDTVCPVPTTPLTVMFCFIFFLNFWLLSNI